MKKFQKIGALALASVMAMSVGFSALADNSGTATVTGAGSSEGSVDKTVYSVDLPTTTSDTLAYIADAQALIQDTNAAAHSGATFPEKASDTHVYFKTGDTTYSNDTGNLQVVNKSTEAIKLTVTVKATDSATPAKELQLATNSTTSAATPLYLALTVGTEVKVLTKTDQTVTKVIPGNADNYEVKYADSAYSYAVKDNPGAWKGVNIKLSGAVSSDAAVAADTTLPGVSVTWAWAAAESSDTASADTELVDVTGGGSGSQTPTVAATQGQAATINLAAQATAKTVTSVSLTSGADTWTLGTARYTYTGGASAKIVLDSTFTQNNWTRIQAGITGTITYNDSTTETFTVTAAA